MKAALLDYGWPNKFRKDDWVRDVGDLENRFYHEWMKEMQDKDLESSVANFSLEQNEDGQAGEP